MPIKNRDAEPHSGVSKWRRESHRHAAMLPWAAKSRCETRMPL